MANADKTQTDKFVLQDVYPDAAAVFSARVEPLSTIKDSAAVVLDTNVLLVPFAVSPQTLRDIRTTYATLAADRRLFVPGQVAREFARNRAIKLAELHQQLLDRKSRLPTAGIGKHPLLENVPEYQAVLAKEAELLDDSKDYGALLTTIADVVKSWTWNDPVSELYRELFTPEVVVDLELDREAIERDLAYRFANQIPPGYKDGSKPDAGIGDLLVWKTILKLATDTPQHTIFVSGEEKSDWWYKSAGRQLYPRFELTDEFRRVSGGKSFHIVSLSELLALYGADQAHVTEVRETEQADARLDANSLLATLAPSLRDAVEQLPQPERTIYLLAEVQGLSYKQIAQALGIPVGTVGWRLFDARGFVAPYLGHAAHRADAIQFPTEQRWDIVHGCVEFPAVIDGSRILCRVSEEALEDFFGAKGYRDAIPVFVSNRSTFERIARDKIAVEDLKDGYVSITTDDFRGGTAG
jgi:DNA-directed RNA polymerase specialized sigma24 family protein